MSERGRCRLDTQSKVPPQQAAGRLNPFPWYAEMRASHPWHRDPERGTWNAFRYEDVQRVLSDHNAFSSSIGGGAGPIAASIIGADPPRHTQLRALVTQAFTPKAVAQLQPRIIAIVSELLDQVVGRGSMDLVEDFAYPLPVIVIAEMLGIPVEDRPRFKVWSDAVVSGGGSGQTQSEMGEYFLNTIARRRREPGADLISGLLAAQIEGRHLDPMELLGFCVLLLVAGNETTTNLIANTMMCLDENPAALTRLCTQPALLPTAVEESLRYRSPVQVMFRTAVRDVRLGDQPVRGGEHVAAWIGSANRDEAQFPGADRFDIARTPNRHIAFGHGVHFCLGAPLARLEANVALGALLQRCRDIRVVAGMALEAVPSTVVFGPRRLPVTFRTA